MARRSYSFGGNPNIGWNVRSKRERPNDSNRSLGRFSFFHLRQNPKEPVRELSRMRWGLIPASRQMRPCYAPCASALYSSSDCVGSRTQSV